MSCKSKNCQTFVFVVVSHYRDNATISNYDRKRTPFKLMNHSIIQMNCKWLPKSTKYTLTRIKLFLFLCYKWQVTTVIDTYYYQSGIQPTCNSIKKEKRTKENLTACSPMPDWATHKLLLIIADRIELHHLLHTSKKFNWILNINDCNMNEQGVSNRSSIVH